MSIQTKLTLFFKNSTSQKKDPSSAFDLLKEKIYRSELTTTEEAEYGELMAGRDVTEADQLQIFVVVFVALMRRALHFRRLLEHSILWVNAS